MKIRILTVGKLKEDFAKEGVKEYKKRLSKFTQIEIIEVDDEKTKENASKTELNLLKDKEGEKLLAKISDKDYVIALAINGKTYDSVAFSNHLSDLMNTGNSTIDFVIGGSVGLSDKVLRRANEKLSFSDFTFPHQLMRVILLEQIFRAFKIAKNEPYHK